MTKWWEVEYTYLQNAWDSDRAYRMRDALIIEAPNDDLAIEYAYDALVLLDNVSVLSATLIEDEEND